VEYARFAPVPYNDRTMARVPPGASSGISCAGTWRGQWRMQTGVPEERVLLGAVKAQTQPNPHVWRVLHDRAGHPFCITTTIPEV
jgi:hypothetical protein